MRKTGIDIMGNAPWGTHFCLFYQTKKDLIDILVPYFKAGLENNEFCMWVCWEPLEAEEAKASLSKRLRNLDNYIKKGQIEIVDYSRQQIEREDSGFTKMKQFWVDKERQALERGFAGLRLAGNTYWLEKREWKDFKQYEEEVDDIIRNHKMLAICPYPLDKCGTPEVIDVVSNHGFALIKRKGLWDLIESSEHKQTKEVLAQKIKKATYQLKKQHQVQENLFVDLAHELKTPLTILKGNCNLALGKGGEKIRIDSKSFANFLIINKEEVDRIDKIINDLFTLAKLETNQLVLQFSKVRLDKLIKKICLRLRAFAGQEKKELLIKKLTPLTVMGDREQLEQLVSNLLDNAIKFTRPKTGQIQISLTQNRGKAKIQVVDNGIGIPKKDLPYIFERFHRGANVNHRLKLKGTGLGLTICQWIVKKHGGKIKVKSRTIRQSQNKKGAGTEFLILLPR